MTGSQIRVSRVELSAVRRRQWLVASRLWTCVLGASVSRDASGQAMPGIARRSMRSRTPVASLPPWTEAYQLQSAALRIIHPSALALLHRVDSAAAAKAHIHHRLSTLSACPEPPPAAPCLLAHPLGHLDLANAFRRCHETRRPRFSRYLLDVEMRALLGRICCGSQRPAAVAL